jgi:hypothetical protein
VIRGDFRARDPATHQISIFRNFLLDLFPFFGNNDRHAIFRRHDRLWPPWTRGHRRSRDYPPRSDLPRGIRRIPEHQLYHEIADSTVEFITADILAEAALPEIPTTGADLADLQANRFDHARDLRKHEDV